ncbi:GNAT family N-acetyltransferase [Phenylobacterium sp.]|uniref:GNAT family N-acetyltransferase n=1 Tax=Phenylobacterium sp. TaxID=1871053 RepID=UPI002731F21A|nr:GNAT family N-acetyltransferase [Phenylobacterium sp.]MDP2213420.1 GNAT family N-acetyltransferase [Phenylobacterium sp.]
MSLRALTPGDLEACHALYQDIGWNDATLSEAETLARRRGWLDWAISNERQLAALHQPPYGDRVICDGAGRFAGLIGIVPRLEPFGRLPGLGDDPGARNRPEIGLFWAVHPAWQGRGLATGAARLLSDWMFAALGLERILAGTERDNLASIGVMRRLGMRMVFNPDPDPPWLQVTGLLEAPS